MTDIEMIFRHVSNRMLEGFEECRAALEHPGQKGAVNEEIAREFFRKHLPRGLDVSTGILVSSEGGVSKQLDIIITDAAKTPVLYEFAGVRVIPVECAYAVIEVKAFLNKAERQAAFENMKSVKGLRKRAYHPGRDETAARVHLYGKWWTDWPIQYYVFAFDSDDLETVADHLLTLQTEQEDHLRIDSACILRKGVIMNQLENGQYSALPEDGARVAASFTANPLLLFHILTSRFFCQACMADVNLIPYMANIRF